MHILNVSLSSRTPPCETLPLLYNILLRYGSKGQIVGAEALINRMKTAGITLRENFFSSIVKAYVSRGELEQAERVMTTIEEAELQPSVITYNCLLKGYVKFNNLVEVDNIRLRMKQGGVTPNASTYAFLVRAYFYNGLIDKVDHMVQTMVQATQGNEFFHEELIKGYISCGLVDQAEEALISLGDNASEVTYTTLLRGYLQSGLFEAAEDVLGRMEKQNLPITNVTYNALLQGYLQKWQFDQAENIVGRMERVRMKPSNAAYKLLVEGYLRCREVGKAESVAASAGTAVYRAVCNNLLSGYAEGGQMDKAEAMLTKVEDAGRNDVLAYTVLLKSYAERGQIEKAEQMINRMKAVGVQPNQYTYNSLLLGYVTGERVDQAEEVLQTMKTDNVDAGEGTYNILLKYYLNTTQLDKAEDVVARMEGAGIVATGWTFNPLIAGWQHVPAKAEGWFLKLMDANIHPSKRAFNSIILAFASAGNKDKAKLYFSKMLESGRLPDVETWESVSQCCSSEEIIELKDQIELKDKGPILSPDFQLCQAHSPPTPLVRRSYSGSLSDSFPGNFLGFSGGFPGEFIQSTGRRMGTGGKPARARMSNEQR